LNSVVHKILTFYSSAKEAPSNGKSVYILHSFD